jgi:hypothetical protein
MPPFIKTSKVKTNITMAITVVETSLLANFNRAFTWFEKDAALRGYVPANGGWTINQILEHIALANHYLLLIINKATGKAVKRAAKNGITDVGEEYLNRLYQVNEIGKHNSFTWVRPEHMEPTGKSAADVKAELAMQLGNCLNCIRSLKNGEGILVNTTMTVNNLGKIDVYQYLYFLAKHIERHITQMQLIENEFENINKHEEVKTYW